MSKSIAKNYIYNVMYQLITLIVPLITVPYTSRVLGVHGIGINSYTASIVQYFVIFGTLGVNLYGNRTIAYVRDDKVKLKQTFWEIVTLQIITTSTAFIIFILVFGTHGENRYIYLAQAINILAASVDISWFFMGLEDFKKTVTRNMVVKIIGVISIFLIIKSPKDVWTFIFITALITLLGQLVMWMYIPKIVGFKKVNIGETKKHIMPAIQLFIPQIATQIYVVLDKTMVGVLSNTNEVAYYDQAQKIIKLTLAVVTSIGVVMLPRMANTFAKNDIKKLNEYLNKSLIFVSYITIPMAFGLIGIAPKFVPWFFGNQFNKVSILISVAAVIMILISWSNVFGVQYLLPTGRNKEFTISVVMGAIINFMFNVTLIPKFLALGGSIATVVAEAAVTFIQILYVKNYINYKSVVVKIVKYTFASILMLISIRAIGNLLSTSMLTTFIQIIVGGIVYFIVVFLTKDDMNVTVINAFFKLIKKK